MTDRELLFLLLEDHHNHTNNNSTSSKQNSPNPGKTDMVLMPPHLLSDNDFQYLKSLSPTSISSGSYDSGTSFSITTTNNTNSKNTFDHNHIQINEKSNNNNNNNDNHSHSSDESRLPVIVRDSRSVIQLQKEIGMKIINIDNNDEVFLQDSSSSLSLYSLQQQHHQQHQQQQQQQHHQQHQQHQQQQHQQQRQQHQHIQPNIQQILLQESKRRDLQYIQLMKRLNEYSNIIIELGGKYEIMAKKMNIHKNDQSLRLLLSKLVSIQPATATTTAHTTAPTTAHTIATATDSNINNYINNHINNNYNNDTNHVNQLNDDKSTVSSIDVNVGNDDDEFTLPISINDDHNSNNPSLINNNKANSSINKYSTLALIGYDNDTISFIEHELKDKDSEIGKLSIYVKEYSDIIANLTNEYNVMIAELAKVDPNSLKWYTNNTTTTNDDSNTIRTSKSNPDVKSLLDGPKPAVRSSVSITDSASSYKYTKIQKLWDGVPSKYMNYDSDDISTQKVTKDLVTKFDKIEEGPNYKFPKPPKYWEQDNKDIVFRKNEPLPFGQDAPCLVDMKKDHHHDKLKTIVEINNDSNVLEKPFWSRGCGNKVPTSSWLSNNRNIKQDINKNLYYEHHKIPGRPSSEQSYKRPGRKISSYVNENASIIAKEIEKKRVKEKQLNEKINRQLEKKEYMERQSLLQNVAKYLDSKKQ
jgi:hypothetical protein